MRAHRVPGRVDRGQRRPLDRRQLRAGGGGVPRLGDLLVGAAATPAAPRSRSPTAASRRASPRRATRRTGTATGARSRRSSRRRPPSGCADRARHWTQHYLDQVVESGEIEFVHDLTCPVPASVTLEWLGYPQDEWQRFSDTFHGVSAYPAGSPEHHKASKAYGPVLAAHRGGAARPDRVAPRRRAHRDRAPRGRRRAAPRGHRAVDHVPHDGRRHRHHHRARRRRAVAPVAVPRRSPDG